MPQNLSGVGVGSPFPIIRIPAFSRRAVPCRSRLSAFPDFPGVSFRAVPDYPDSRVFQACRRISQQDDRNNNKKVTTAAGRHCVMAQGVGLIRVSCSHWHGGRRRGVRSRDARVRERVSPARGAHFIEQLAGPPRKPTASRFHTKQRGVYQPISATTVAIISKRTANIEHRREQQ